MLHVKTTTWVSAEETQGKLPISEASRSAAEGIGELTSTDVTIAADIEMLKYLSLSRFRSC